MPPLIRQIQPMWAQLQPWELPVPANALRHALLALAAGVLVMSGLAAGSTFWAPTRTWWMAIEGGSSLVAGLQASLLAALATAVGALPVFAVQRLTKRQESAFLAFSAGVMLAATVFALLLPSLQASKALIGGGGAGALLTGLGLALGMGLMLGIDRALPHEHAVLPPAAPGHASAWAPATGASQRTWLMVLALMIHNLPEGLAVGAAYAGPAQTDTVHAGATVALAIGLLMLGSLPAFYPLGLALAAGAMLFVVSHEIIPETHRNGFEGAASATLLAGFVFMIWLNEVLA